MYNEMKGGGEGMRKDPKEPLDPELEDMLENDSFGG
jgi:hypothetical protein